VLPFAPLACGEKRVSGPEPRKYNGWPEHFRQLRGKRVAIPSRFAVDFLFLRKMLAQENMTPDELEILEIAPPDMPAALWADAVDAYSTGEPFGASAESAGWARPLRMTRESGPSTSAAC
jgi:NitT/TauT family transport system substrate-binding protein